MAYQTLKIIFAKESPFAISIAFLNLMQWNIIVLGVLFMKAK
jgi:hypothetical protein